MVVDGTRGKIIAGRGININGKNMGNVIDAKDSPLPSNFRWNSSGDVGATKSPKRKWSPKRNVTAFDGEGNPIEPDERGNIQTSGDAFVTSNRPEEDE